LFALAGSAIPIFWFALFLQYFFAITLNDYMPKLDWPISLRLVQEIYPEYEGSAQNRVQ
jgi:ABC-type dipeptide/oligopeptide/nickel transport system permease component